MEVPSDAEDIVLEAFAAHGSSVSRSVIDDTDVDPDFELLSHTREYTR